MSKKKYELVTHIFKGGRFDDHGLDVDVLPELIAYKNILMETAKEIWRRKNAGRQRLPKNFEDSLNLKFYELLPGSTAIPLMREIEGEDQLTIFDRPKDELDEAVDVVAGAIESVSRDKPVPAAFPRNVISLFDDYGKTLRQDESFEHKLPEGRTAARYSLKERDGILKLSQAEYQDVVDLLGELRAADLDGGNFALRLADGTKVLGKFSPDQENVITDALREHQSRRLRIKGKAEFYPDGKLKRVASVESITVEPAGTVGYDETARPIWQIISEIGASVPDEEWATIPTDLSKNIDHYLYGAPKEGK